MFRVTQKNILKKCALFEVRLISPFDNKNVCVCMAIATWTALEREKQSKLVNVLLQRY
jgi:hypothetical protein